MCAEGKDWLLTVFTEKIYAQEESWVNKFWKERALEAVTAETKQVR